MNKYVYVLSLAIVLSLAFAGTNWLRTVIAESDQDSDENETSANETPELPNFAPSIADRTTYEKFDERQPPSSPLPNSEIADITFSREWLTSNDTESHPGNIAITFPTTWLNKSPRVRKDDAVNLRIPKKMLELNDTSNNPNEITVTLKSNLFFGYSHSPEYIADYPSIDYPTIKSESTMNNEAVIADSNTFHKHKIVFFISRTGLTKIEGAITPLSYSNSGETFHSYHEHEIGMNSGDVVEFVSDFEDNGDITVRLCIYDDSADYVTPYDFFWINATENQTIEYYLYIYSGFYWMSLYDCTNGDWYSTLYFNGDYQQIDSITAATELWDRGGLSQDFEVITYPLVVDRFGDEQGIWYTPESSLHPPTIDPFVPHVLAWYTFNDYNLLTYHRADCCE